MGMLISGIPHKRFTQHTLSPCANNAASEVYIRADTVALGEKVNKMRNGHTRKIRERSGM